METLLLRSGNSQRTGPRKNQLAINADVTWRLVLSRAKRPHPRQPCEFGWLTSP
jgi:hypothetical protein